MNKKNNRKGFTTVELVIVIAVIAILATALIPTFGGLIDSANDTKAMSAARQIYNDYMLKHAENGGADDNYYIVAEGKYFEVAGGKLTTKASTTVTKDEQVPCTHKLVTATTIDNPAQGTSHTWGTATTDCGVTSCPSTGNHSHCTNCGDSNAN